MKEFLNSLKNNFGDCKHASFSLCVKKTSYEIIEASIFFIFDDKDENPVKVVTSNDEYQLIVRNKERKSICLVKTDKCLFKDNAQQKKCDCILFSDDELYFVEISNSSRGARHAKRKNAVEQLADTIELFRHFRIDLSTKNPKARICFKGKHIRTTQSSSNSKKAIFEQKYKVRLEEGNEIVF